MKQTTLILLVLAITTGVVFVSPASAGEIGFIEQFALADDRAEPLKQLIPGAEDYYYYHSLHYLNTGQYAEAGKTLDAWLKRTGQRNDRIREIEYRKALLEYGDNPEKTLEFIRNELGLQFQHKKELLDKKTNLPTRLDASLFARERLTKSALDRNIKTTEGFEDGALEWLAAAKLDADRQRDLLRRMTQPDPPELLPTLIVADLKYENSQGFGAMEIHKRLTLEQLDACARLMPELRNQTAFVSQYLKRLRTSDDVDWRHDNDEREAFLDRLWSFVSELDPAHNSLKAHILYHRLVHDRQLDRRDKTRFLAYLKLPRNIGYVPREYLNSVANRGRAANLASDYIGETSLNRVGNDEELVRDYLARYFLEEKSVKTYAPYVLDTTLNAWFAETMIVNGVGDAAERERWYSMLSPAKYQEIKERVDIDFAPTNRNVFAADEPVRLDLLVKNVKKMIVKVYEINTPSYYRAEGKELDTNINLDGLVANDQTTHEYKEVDLLRVARHFEFPKLKERGVYVIEFIGNGMSSRALVRKGQLRFLERLSVAGHAFTVLDETNRQVTDATIWIAGREYKPKEDGTIFVPFSTKPGSQQLILQKGDFASLDTFNHLAEQYAFTAGFHVNRESLLRSRKATVAIRPSLTVHGTPAPLEALEKPILVITSVDCDGVSSTKEVDDFKLSIAGEATHEFQVPNRLASIAFTLKASVRNLSLDKDENLSASKTFQLNGIDATEKVEDLHFTRLEKEYVVDLLGRSGEPKPDRPIQIRVKHKDFKEIVQQTLQSDASGRASLGALEDVEWIEAQGPENTKQTWRPSRDLHTYPATVNGMAGEPVWLPYMGSAAEPNRSELALLEKRAGVYYKDRFEAMRLEEGMIRIEDVPAGDYELLIKPTATRVTIRLTGAQKGVEPTREHGYALGATRHLEIRNERPLQIASIDSDAKETRILLANASPLARVHVIATRYAPAFDIYGNLSVVPVAEPYLRPIPPMESVYLAGRDIGEEYRYIIERKGAKIIAGNMLKRPGLLINPWAVRKTESDTKTAAEGEEWAETGAPEKPSASRASSSGRERGGTAAGPGGDFANLDFLAGESVVLLNLEPDKSGGVTIAREALGEATVLHVVAIDVDDTVWRSKPIPGAAPRPKRFDLRLALGLDPKTHFTEQKRISLVGAGEEFVVPNILTSRVETYDTLAKVYRLYATLSNDPTLAEFRFILDWPKMKPEEKREKYSKYACHELHYFLFRKDPEFFRAVIAPYLANKKDKTFLDDWFLAASGESLAGYAKPWRHERLNIAERTLLGRRLPGEAPAMARHVSELCELLPPNIDRFNHLFDTAIKGSALETEGIISAGVEYRAATMLRTSPVAAEFFARGGGAAGGRELANRTLMEGISIDAPAAPAAMPALAKESKSLALLRPAPPRGDVAQKLEALAKSEVADAKWEEKMRRGFVAGYAMGDMDARGGIQALYRKLDKTQEFAENNYYHLPVAEQNADRVPVNAFWRDWAVWDAQGEFRSTNLAEASTNFTEMMLALAALDLPFETPEYESKIENDRLTLRPKSALVVFHKEIREAKEKTDGAPILISQNFFRHDDRFLHENGEKFDKFVTEEFLTHVVYGCQVAITNPTSSRRKLDILIEIPRGSIPVLGGKATRGVHVALEPYATTTQEYYFYFPEAGGFAHFPVHVAREGSLLTYADPFLFNVVEKLTKIDKASWNYISQFGTVDETIAFLENNNIGRVQLSRIAWRMADRAFFLRVLELLEKRHAYDQTLWSYSIRHNHVAGAREFLQHDNRFLQLSGMRLESPLATIDPVERRLYEHLEYSPLVNARAHQLGKKREILNDRFLEQYQRLMRSLSYAATLDDADQMSVTYYLLLQDRVEEALKFFARVDASRLPTSLQYDYLTVYLNFYTGDFDNARKVVGKYAEYPVERWRKLFSAAAAQLDEIASDGKSGQDAVDKEDRDEKQTRLAAAEPSLDFKVESRRVELDYQNLAEARVNYYLMDIELLFSRNPFVREFSGQFSSIRPNAVDTLRLDPKATKHAFDLPERFHGSNVMVEILAGGVRKTQTYFANSLNVQTTENYGQTRVTHEKTGKPLSKVYVKVYARMRDGRVQFYKDGYTDPRGRFDYSSLNTNELDQVERFALLVLSETDGAVVREAAPPKQ